MSLSLHLILNASRFPVPFFTLTSLVTGSLNVPLNSTTSPGSISSSFPIVTPRLSRRSDRFTLRSALPSAALTFCLALVKESELPWERVRNPLLIFFCSNLIEPGKKKL